MPTPLRTSDPATEPILSPELVARLARFRLVARRRVNGRYAGGHASKRFGSSLDFADYREYARGDDPRRVDLSAYLRLGKLLVKLYEAEDEAAIRVVVDLSASMGYGDKTRIAREIAAAFTALAANGQDRCRVLIAGARHTPGSTSTEPNSLGEFGTSTYRGDPASGGGGASEVAGDAQGVDAGPWFRGPTALVAVEHRLRTLVAPDAARDTEDAPGRPDIVAAIRRANGEGPRGPVVLVSDLMFDGWEDVIRALAAGRGDAIIVQVLATTDVEPDVRGDLRLVDAETGTEVEVGIADDALDAYAVARDGWFAELEALAGQHGVAIARVLDDTDVEDLVLTTLRRIGVVGS